MTEESLLSDNLTVNMIKLLEGKCW